jgi:LysM repeat protein
MYGIDISKHNGNINLEPYRGQFVIIRVGYGHFHLDEKFERNVNECKRLGIPFGVYHYSYALNEADAEAEARGVLNAIAKYKNDIKVGVWFDMEDADGYKKKHGFKFSNSTIAPICYKFCKMIEDAGYYSGIYTSSSWLDYVNGLNDRFDKWVANWGKNDGSQHTNTSQYGTLQQYTSKPLDKNVMYADLSRYSRGNTTPVKPQLKPINQIADEVIAGQWGDGADRKKRLTDAGYDYNAVQDIVNKKVAPMRKSNDQIASEVIAGQWGDGNDRKNRLEQAGYNYDAVQKVVNQKMNAKKQPAHVYYVVKRGDTLSGIASKYGTTYQKLAQMNGISNPNKIYPGQRIRVK